MTEAFRTETIRLYRPLPSALDFHNSLATERLLRGGNRSGKTIASAVECASVATGTPIYDTYGDETLPLKFPTNRPLIIWIIGYDQTHIGDTIYRVLFKSGLFKMIRDPVTGKWRAFRPLDPIDACREREARPSRPLIENRFIDPKGWSWEDMAARIFNCCKLRNGTEIHAFSSKAECPQGVPVDFVWIDEDIKYPGLISKLRAGLSEKKGRLIWSTFPHSNNHALVNMSKRAVDQAERPSPDVAEFRLRFSDNPFVFA